MPLLDELNSEQREAARSLQGPLLILAGAGSGKTRTITYRIAHMIKENAISPDSILAITFTNKSAKEMKERVRSLLGRGKKLPTLCTFHALGLQILKEDITKLGYQKNFTLYDRADQTSLIREALKQFKGGKAFDRSQVLSMIGELKNKNITASDYASSPFFDPDDDYCIATEHCFHFMEDKLKFYNAIDFDDILLLVCRLFKEHPEVAAKYSKRFQYLLVDEYQDTNSLQFNMIKGITSQHNNICVVGDDDQSIYGFRGADINNILSFEHHFPNSKVIKLEQNYRSTAPILNLANQVIRLNKKRKEKSMWTQESSGEKPLLWVTQDATHEAQIVADEINKLRNKGEELKNIAILYRSNTQTPPFEDELRLNQVPYRLLGGQKLYERKEVKDIIAYLSLISNPYNDISLRRILNVPSRGIGNVTLHKYLELSDKIKKPLYFTMQDHANGLNDQKVINFLSLISQSKDFFKNLSLSESVEKVIELTKYYQHIEKFYEGTKQVDLRKNSLNLLIQSAERFQNQADFKPTLKNFIEKILITDSQDSQDEEQGEKNEVTMMTLHSSKGLEFDHVFLVGMEEELLPHKKTIQLDQDISEERRLCYVGITRARKRLIMTRCKERKIYNKNIPRNLSRFLIQLPDFYTEQDRTCFGHMSQSEAETYKSQVFSSLLDSLD